MCACRTLLAYILRTSDFSGRLAADDRVGFAEEKALLSYETERGREKERYIKGFVAFV